MSGRVTLWVEWRRFMWVLKVVLCGLGSGERGKICGRGWEKEDGGVVRGKENNEEPSGLSGKC